MATKKTDAEERDFVVTTLKEVCTFKRSEAVTVHVRVVTFGEDKTPKLDLRQYVDGKNWKGWGKGLALSAAEWDELQTTTVRSQIADALRLPAAPGNQFKVALNPQAAKQRKAG